MCTQAHLHKFICIVDMETTISEPHEAIMLISAAVRQKEWSNLFTLVCMELRPKIKVHARVLPILLWAMLEMPQHHFDWKPFFLMTAVETAFEVLSSRKVVLALAAKVYLRCMISGRHDVSLSEKNGMNLLTRLLFRVLFAASVHGGELEQIALRLLLVWRNFQKSNEHVFRCAVCSKVEHQQWIRTGVEEEQQDVTLTQAQLSRLDYCDLKLCVRTKNLFFFLIRITPTNFLNDFAR